MSRWVKTTSKLCIGVSKFYVMLQRVKILFNKKDTALIQMAEPQQAMLAISHLDKCKLWGKVTKTCAWIYILFCISYVFS